MAGHPSGASRIDAVSSARIVSHNAPGPAVGRAGLGRNRQALTEKVDAGVAVTGPADRSWRWISVA